MSDYYEKQNIIIIQIESLDNKIIDYAINGKEVTPFLNKLKRNSIYFKNFIAQHSAGCSSDAELSALTSLLPLSSHVGLSSLNYNKVATLAKILKELNYNSFASQGSSGDLFGSSFAYPKLGFNNFYDKDDFTDSASGWYSQDLEFFEQNFIKLKKIKEPFFAYIITMQSHGPFQNYNPKTKKMFKFTEEFTENQKDYISSIHEVDIAIENFFTLIMENEKTKNSIIILYSDHLSGVFQKKTKGFENIPLFIINSGVKNRIEYKPVSHIDIAPTICDILGIEEGQNWLGTSMFDSNKKTKVLLNDLSIIESENKKIKTNKDFEYQKYINFSKSLFD